MNHQHHPADLEWRLCIEGQQHALLLLITVDTGLRGSVYFWGRPIANLASSSRMKFVSDNLYGWVERSRFLIVLAIIFAVYAMALIAFLTFRLMEEEASDLGRERIAKCLDSGGHIGRGETCWHVAPNENNELVP